MDICKYESIDIFSSYSCESDFNDSRDSTCRACRYFDVIIENSRNKTIPSIKLQNVFDVRKHFL